MKPKILLGMPIFREKPGKKERLQCPMGHVDLFKKITEQPYKEHEIAQHLAQEYAAIGTGVIEMGYEEIGILKPKSFNTKYLTKLADGGITMIELPMEGMHNRFVFVRDLWTRIPSTDTVMIPEFEKKEVFSSFLNYTPEGSILCEGGKNFITDKYFFSFRFTDYASESVEYFLAENHVPKSIPQKIILLPNPILYCEEGADKGWVPEMHIDRASSIITDKRGDIHVFIDPKLHIGIEGLGTASLISSENSISMITEQLHTHGITNIHVPKELPVPYGLGAMQFHDGKVLLSGGQPEVAAMYREILGNDQVFETEIPITHYSAILRSGIRCLINEY